MPAGRVRASEHHKLVPFETPRSSPWVVPLPPGAVSKLLPGFRGSSQDDRYFVYTDGPSADGEVVVHIHRSWTGVPLAAVTIKGVVVSSEAEEGGLGFLEDDGAGFTKIVYEGEQRRWDSEMLGPASLDTARGFAMHVCGDWIFGIKFPKVIWEDVDARYRRAWKDYVAELERLQEEEEETRREVVSST